MIIVSIFFIGLMACSIIGLVLVRTFFSITTVRGLSMYPTLVPGDRLLVVHHWPGRWLQNNQIVIVKRRRISVPEDHEAEGKNFVKRIVGLPGETVIIKLSEVHEIIRPTLATKCNSERELVWHIPQGHFFVRGDGAISSDSITWGPIPAHTISGLMLLKLPCLTGATGASTTAPFETTKPNSR